MLTKLKNSEYDYGLISIIMHWVVAVSVIGLFILGYWMIDLTYYSDYYRLAPWVHKSVGILVFAVMSLRLGWRLYSPAPKAEKSLKPIEKKAAHVVHVLLYLLIFTILVSGYLISTADGRSITVFNWFDVPALITGLPHQADIAGKVHWYTAVALMGLVGLHAAGALKHHLIDGDHTLKKIFGIKRS